MAGKKLIKLTPEQLRQLKDPKVVTGLQAVRSVVKATNGTQPKNSVTRTAAMMAQPFRKPHRSK